MKTNTLSLIFLTLLTCVALTPNTQAVIPAPDGGYPNGNTAEGQNALFGLSTGAYNTAVGFFSLRTNATNSFNTAIGAGALFAMKPVSFRYKKDIDPAGIQQFGLVAEDVENVNPDPIVRDKEGKPYSVRYDQVNAMLLNEFLKEHRKVEEQEATIAQLRTELRATATHQQEQIEALTAGLQKVSAQMQLNKSAP